MHRQSPEWASFAYAQKPPGRSQGREGSTGRGRQRSPRKAKRNLREVMESHLQGRSSAPSADGRQTSPLHCRSLTTCSAPSPQAPGQSPQTPCPGDVIHSKRSRVSPTLIFEFTCTPRSFKINSFQIIFLFLSQKPVYIFPFCLLSEY